MKKILSGVLALVLAGSAFALDSENFIPEGIKRGMGDDYLFKLANAIK